MRTTGKPTGVANAGEHAGKRVRRAARRVDGDWGAQAPMSDERLAMTMLEYFNTPETVQPHELIFGTMRVADAPFVRHQRAAFRMAVALDAYARRHGGEVIVAPIDVVLDAQRALVLQPDLLFVSAERAWIVQERVYGVPDLVVEVLSPHPRIGRIEEKIQWFAEYGAREIWVYHQMARRLRVLSCEHGAVVQEAWFDDEARIQSRVLSGFDQTLTQMEL